MSFNELGFFQFDNLVQNRIPFLLVNLGVDFTGWFNSVSVMHLENNTLNTTPDKALADIEAKKLPQHYAVVVICADGKDSGEIAKALEAKGLLNAYSVRGGIAGLSQDKLSQK